MINIMEQTKEELVLAYSKNIEQLLSERGCLYDDLRDFKLDYYSSKYKLERMDKINREIKSLERKIEKLILN